MRKFYSILGALLIGATSLFAQTNYTVTFSANVEMEKVQVKNLSSGKTKMLYSPDNVITLQKVEKQGTPIASVDNPMFLQQTANNEVIVNMEKAGHLSLTLYSLNGTFVARYSNNIDAGQNAFQIGASTGMYVLVATAGGKSASLKLSLTQNSQPGIYEIITSKSDVFLKSVEDVITFYEGDTFEFIGYYYKQTDKKTAVITSDQAITFSFTKATAPTVTTVQATDITYDAATVGGKVNNDNGATVTERGICWNTTGNPTIEDNKETSGTGTGSFTATLSSLSDGTTFYARAYAENGVGISYGKIVTFTTRTLTTIENGVIKACFSVSDSKRIYFSQGNLQYQASTGTWRFAEHQWDIIGKNNENISQNYDGWVDLFGWGTSGYNDKYPYLTSSTSTDYGDGANDIAGTNYDWGMYNKIENGGNQIGQWRTLTKNEFSYLLFDRENARYLKGYVTINGIYGIILLPDDWKTPSSVQFFDYHLGEMSPKNEYSLEEWTIMQSYGAVFLPAAGRRGDRAGTNSYYNDTGKAVLYWLSSAKNEHSAYEISRLNSDPLDYLRIYGCAVRLVQDVKKEMILTSTLDIITTNATNVTNSTVTIGGNIIADNDVTITERGICWATTSNPTIADNKKTSGQGIGNFSVTLSSLSEKTTYYVRAYAKNEKGTLYGDEVKFTTKPIVIVNGVIQKAFSVSENGKKVYFSQGNLQYQASTGLWHFAENQWDFVGTQKSSDDVGGTVDDSDNRKTSSTYSGWIDLFGWGTSGWSSGANAYQPYSTSERYYDYYPGGSNSNELTGSYASADWGVYNKISNGGNQTGLWRTLTYQEWQYLIEKRENASSKYGIATVNNINGLVLLPDSWTLPSGVTFTSGVANVSGSDYYKTVNNYSAEEWAKLEANGAVFLPAAGIRHGTNVLNVGFQGFYWSSSSSSLGYHSFCLIFRSENVIVGSSSGYKDRSCGLSVRLVRDL
ncbi:MAG: T9SS type A sorting domain-containing protein [Bacteroidales bacterium]|nr:T9SS type A sorting domain-containing protein [Bacteroidales bacterium]